MNPQAIKYKTGLIKVPKNFTKYDEKFYHWLFGWCAIIHSKGGSVTDYVLQRIVRNNPDAILNNTFFNTFCKFGFPSIFLPDLIIENKIAHRERYLKAVIECPYYVIHTKYFELYKLYHNCELLNAQIKIEMMEMELKYPLIKDNFFVKGDFEKRFKK